MVWETGTRGGSRQPTKDSRERNAVERLDEGRQDALMDLALYTCSDRLAHTADSASNRAAQSVAGTSRECKTHAFGRR